ncbi:MAG TPA: hypothetical protein VMB52_03685 [Verrucomicrobiae bacterium]|nr:hypothetical protein [Verrucomicrobiae bacterium]
MELNPESVPTTGLSAAEARYAQTQDAHTLVFQDDPRLDDMLPAGHAALNRLMSGYLYDYLDDHDERGARAVEAFRDWVEGVPIEETAGISYEGDVAATEAAIRGVTALVQEGCGREGGDVISLLSPELWASPSARQSVPKKESYGRRGNAV